MAREGRSKRSIRILWLISQRATGPSQVRRKVLTMELRETPTSSDPGESEKASFTSWGNETSAVGAKNVQGSK